MPTPSRTVTSGRIGIPIFSGGQDEQIAECLAQLIREFGPETVMLTGEDQQGKANPLLEMEMSWIWTNLYGVWSGLESDFPTSEV